MLRYTPAVGSIALLVLVGGCGLMSRLWHDTNARYNAYYLAKERMKDAEEKLWEQSQDDYNRILTIHPNITSSVLQSISGDMDYIIKKASLPVQRHKGSRWVDDCYNLIGKARFYTEDYENAITTFKYVNTKGQDKEDKNAALIWLMRMYMQQDKEAYIREVRNVLEEKDLTTENQKEYYKVEAQRYINQKNWRDAEEHAGFAVALEREAKKRARLYFIIGQIRERRGHKELAYESYKSVLRNSPHYELEFFAKLGMARSSNTNLSKKELEDLKDDLFDMLEDDKNKEYRGRIYHELAQFELNRHHLQQCLKYLQKATKEDDEAANQKGYSYLMESKLYYNRPAIKDYIQSKKYLDSAVMNLDSNAIRYDSVMKRHKIMKEFVKHFKVVQEELEDQRVANMSEEERQKYFEQKAAEERKRRERERKKELARQKAQQQAANSDMGGDDPFAGTDLEKEESLKSDWQLDNRTAVARGKRAFKRNWGERPLADNWRLSSKIQDVQPQQEDTTQLATKTEDQEPRQAQAMAEKAEEEGGKDPYAKYKKDIPMDEEAMEKSNKKLAESLFQVAYIFQQDLKETPEAVKYYEMFIEKFPQHDKAAEAAYSLWLIYKRRNQSEEQERIRTFLKTQHPKTDYAHLIDNPDYRREEQERNRIVKARYKEAFNAMKQGDNVRAITMVNDLIKRYPENDYRPYLELLKIRINGRTLDPQTYIGQLKGFVEKYPEHQLKKPAEDMIAKAEAYLKKQKQPEGGPPPADSGAKQKTQKPQQPQYDMDVQKARHYFILVVDRTKVQVNTLQNELADFNKTYFSGDNLHVDNLLLGKGNKALIRVKGLETAYQVQRYKRRITARNGPIKKLPAKVTTLMMAEKNFKTFYQSKDIGYYQNIEGKLYN